MTVQESNKEAKLVMGSLDNDHYDERPRSPLEDLPVVVFYEITKFLPVVDYQDDFGGCNPFFRLVKFNRGYALAIVSRRCNALFEETANIYLRAHTPPDYFRPPLPRDESASCLSQFYTFKAAECKFRYELHRLYKVQKNAEPKVFFERVRCMLAVEHFVSDWEPHALDACLAACRRALKMDSTRMIEGSLDASAANEACPLLHQIVSRSQALLQALPPDKRHDIKGQLLVTMAVYYFALIESEPPNEPAAVACLQRALDMYDTHEFVNGFHQKLRLYMYRQLVRLHVEAERFDEGFALLQQARADTRHLDPLNLRLLAKLVRAWSQEFGLERSIAFLQESQNQLEETTPSELIWRDGAVNEAMWSFCIRQCLGWLRELESRRPGQGTLV